MITKVLKWGMNNTTIILTHGRLESNIQVCVEQLKSVISLLDTNDINYYVDEESISLDGKPEIIIVHLNKNSDVNKVQNVFNSSPMFVLASSGNNQKLPVVTIKGTYIANGRFDVIRKALELIKNKCENLNIDVSKCELKISVSNIQ